MRVLHGSNDYHHSIVYKTLHEGFLKTGDDHTFFVPMPFGTMASYAPSVINAPCFYHWDRYFYMHKQKKVYRTFRAVIERCKPDLLHGYFLFSMGIPCLWAKRELGIPYVVTVQNTDVNTIYRIFPHLHSLAREILENASAVIFPSVSYREQVLNWAVSKEQRERIDAKSFVIPFAVQPFWNDLTAPSRHTQHEGSLRLLTVGTVDKNKNQLCTLRAAECLSAQGIPVELSVVGETKDENIQRVLEQSPLVRRVLKLPKEQLIDEYRRADIFVLPSITESFGLVYAEALSQGLPILYTAGQGFDGQFSEGYVGYHVDAHDPESIAEAVRRVMEQYPALQSHCGTAAKRFSQAQVCEEIEYVYKAVITESC